ncbi:hypothetical protein [Acidovorax sp. ST3]|uniref:hypothetical protein n=1 Tax=Acidovorax sp. ST3 TaxID=2219062 RepID=UPI00351458AC
MRHIVEVGGRTDGGVHQSRVNIHADVCIDAEVPLVALLGPVHLGVSLTLIILGRAERRDNVMVASTMVPVLSIRPRRARPVLMAARTWGASWYFSSR